MEDFELLLLSWTQLTALEMIDPNDKHVGGKKDLEEALLADFDITSLTLISRTFDTYTIAFEKKGEQQEIIFEANDVESIYDI